MAPLPAPIELIGPWQLRFPPGGGVPAGLTLDKLMSWPEAKNIVEVRINDQPVGTL